MAKINFYLNNKIDSKGYAAILLYFSARELRVPVTTNETVFVKAWNRNTQRVRASYEEAKSINNRLEELELRVKKMYREDFIDVAPRRCVIKEKIQHIINPPEEAGSNDFIDFALSYTKNCLRKHETKKNYTQVINHLLAFKNQHKEYRKDVITFNHIDLDFYNQFYKYLEVKVGLSKNTIGTHIKNIKVFMKQSLERNLHKNHSFMLSGFKVVNEQTDAPYLSTAELQKIYETDFSDQLKYERIRDLFLVGCWTGLRYSDWSQVLKKNIFNNDYLRVKTVKGDKLITIPLHRCVKEILAKYDYKLPHVISNQKLNDYLKEICQKAGINDTVSNTITKGGKRLQLTNYKWEKISTHTARRSFATNMYNMQVPGLTIMAITGHSTEKSFLKYIKINQHQHAERLLEIWKQITPLYL